MKKFIILLLTTALLPNLYSQENYSEQYGKITQYEMSITEYPDDPDAEALVLYSLGNNYFRGVDGQGFFLYMEVKRKIKILKQAGVIYANIEIPLYKKDSEIEYLQDVDATVYNMENGQLVKSKFDTKKIFDEKINNELSIKKIALPDVREGSIIEYKYKIETPFFFHMRKWNFQEKIPVIQSKLIYKAIPYFEYTYIVRGAKQFDEYDSQTINRDISFAGLTYKEKLYTFGMKDLPAFRDEEFISSEKDFIASINFQISRTYSFYNGAKRDYMSTWPEMCNEFLKDPDFGKYIKDSEKEGKKIVSTLNLSDKSELEQAKIISEYVKNMYSWDGYNTKYSTDKLSSFLKAKRGTAADINLFLIGLLKSAQIDTEPLVLSTRNNGSVSKGHPFQQFLNYVIARVVIDGKTYFIDATDPLRHFDELPTRCTNVEGLVVKAKSEEEWLVTTQKEISSIEKEFKIKVIPPKSLLDVQITYTLSGQEAYDYRSIYSGKEENLIENFRKKNNINKIDSLHIFNYENPEKPFKFTFTSSTGFESTPDKLFIHPFCNLSISSNIFKQKQRMLPIDLIYLQKEAYKSEITIPNGYEIEYIPNPLEHSSRIMDINYKSEINNNKIIITATYEFNTNIYDAKDYARLKGSFSVLIKQFSDMVVLKKK
ncbi:DUF3857 domain-containing protein [Dysgonomonas macrotermitis]|uniref:Uncharacterized protein n=1 Tax=Dysgonomonas macrotermitis TaxID=1346286 RepID=A0A1M5BTG0_9BACT|nr:DUF3857 domain-containing protein [Dysgonomonas macrotermitis]SHF45547.1 protein of unknown function [Dysgonomonas macrotermitis]